MYARAPDKDGLTELVCCLDERAELEAKAEVESKTKAESNSTNIGT